MVDFPHPEGPTMATFFPAGMVKLRSRKMGREGWYPNVTFSKRIDPPSCKDNGAAFGSSYTKQHESWKVTRRRKTYNRRWVFFSQSK